MRRWTLTLFLTAAAGAALFLAPRLVGSPEPVIEPVAPAVVPRISDPIPEAVAPIPIDLPTIPEVQTPPPPPVDFWPDAVDCGMG